MDDAPGAIGIVSKAGRYGGTYRNKGKIMIEYDKFKKTLKLLEEQNNRLSSLSDGQPDWLIDAIKGSVIQRFETCWDYLWKILRRYLLEEIGLPNVPNGPNPVLRSANENDLLPTDVEYWLKYAATRFSTSHDYSGEKAKVALGIMKSFVDDAIGLYQTLSGESWRLSKELDNIDLTVTQRKKITTLLKRYVPNTEVWAYGSRGKFTAKPNSDLDMVVFVDKEQSTAVFELKEAFEESDLPFRVDLFVWNEVPEKFHKNIKEERVVLQGRDKGCWAVVGDTLEGIAEIVMGQSPPGKAAYAIKVGLPLLNGPTEFGSSHPVPVQFTTDVRKRAFQGDLLFCVRGSMTGRMNWADQEYVIGRGIAAIRHRESLALQPYVRAVIEYCLNNLLAQATGSTFPNVSAAQLKLISFPRLETITQRAIAHILGSLDDKIELSRQMNHTLEKMAQAIFKSWFIDFDPVRAKAEGRDTGLPKDIADLFPDSFEDSELGEIPKGWEAGCVADLGEVICGKTPPTKSSENYGKDVPFITIPDMHGKVYVTGTGKCLSKRGADTQKNKYLPPHSVYASCIATPRLVILTSNEVQTNQQINSVISKTLSPLYIYVS